MSALPVSYAPEQLAEFDLLLEVSRICNSARSAKTALDAAAAITMRFVEINGAGLTGDSAAFVAQQIALMLNRLELEKRRKSQKRQIASLKRRLQTRKIVERTHGVLAIRHNLDQGEALRLLFRFARTWRKNLYDTSEAVLFGVDETPVVLRRLTPSEPTVQLRRSVAV
jgi:hypothetical protein